MANFEAFRWNISSSTNSEIGRSDFVGQQIKELNCGTNWRTVYPPEDILPNLRLKYAIITGEFFICITHGAI